ncbi:MAG: ATP-binding protein [Aequorivita sp.]|nr:MAG: ATP-binding protein [Aequorivita sp.]
MKKNQLSFLYFFILGLFLFPKLSFSQQSKDSVALLYQAIVSPNSSSNISQAINFYSHKKEEDLKQKDTTAAIIDLRLIAMGEFKIGNIYDSESTVVKALNLIDSYSKKDTLIENRKALYNQLGQIYRELNDYNKAIEIYNLSLSYSTSFSDSITLINNKANVYKDLGNYEKAAENLTLAHKLMKRSNDSLKLAMVLDNLGRVQSKLGNPNALSNLNRALQIRERKNDVSKTYSSYKNLALYHFSNNNMKEAQLYTDKAYKIALQLNSLIYLENALSLYVIISGDQKILEYKNVTDSIAKQKQLAQNKNALLKYNFEKERKKTMEERLEKEQQKKEKIIYFSLALFILLTSSYLIITLRQKHKKEKIIQVHTTETRISKKVHDEVANDVYQLMAKIQGNNNDKEKLLDDLENIYNKTRDISKENNAIEIEENFSGQLNDLLLNYQSEKVSIATRNISKMDWVSISEIKKATVFRVLQELMTNMKKYSEASAVVLSFQQVGKKITIEYTDNGKGCIIKNKNGLQNAENRIHAIKGTITFDSEPGKGFKSKINI